MMIVLYGTIRLLRSTRTYRRLADRLVQILSAGSDSLLPLVYSNLVPDALLRWGIRLRLADQLTRMYSSEEQVENEMATKMSIVKELKLLPVVAIETKAANEQHYEVPSAFYDLCLGPRKKYSSGWWPSSDTTFEQSEEHMLELYVERSGVRDGMSVVDLGCGWGSMTLYLLERFPNCRVTSISNSHSQREYIMNLAKERGFDNRLKILTCDVSDDGGALDEVKDQDLVITIEMFEHMKNYSKLLQKVHSFLKPNTGRLFVHIFTHKRFAYHFEDGWMAENFFTGGTMPSDDLLLYFGEYFYVQNHWRVNGTNYQRTSNGWLKYLDDSWKRGKLEPVLNEAYGKGKAKEWYVNWRLFFLSCAELFGYDKGKEWIVSHYLFQRK